MKWKKIKNPIFLKCMAILLVCTLVITGSVVYAELSNNNVEYTTKGGEWTQVNDTTFTMDKDGDGEPDITLVKNGDTWKYYFTVADPDAQYYAYEDGVPEGYEVTDKGTRADPVILNKIKAKYSHTTNVDDAGNQISSEYGNSQSKTDVIQIPGATSLKVTVTYQTESTSYDWVCLWTGSHFDYTASNNYGSSICGKLGGNKNTTEYTVDGDTVTIGFRSDGSACGYYGYYAVVEGTGPSDNDGTITNKSTTDIPGGFTLTKQTAGTAADTNKNFKFDITLSTDEEPLQKFVTGTNTYGNITFKNGTGTAYLKSGETVEINGLPEGMRYQITETNAEDYQTVWTTDGESGEPSGIIEKGKTKAIVCTNTKNATPEPEPTATPKTASLTVLNTAVNGNPDDVFDYHMVLWGLEVGKTYTYLKGNSSVSYQADSTGIADITFTLKDGEHTDFSNLPILSQYQIIQEANDYEASFKIENGIKNAQTTGINTKTNTVLNTAKETLTEDETPVVHFTNTIYIEPEPEGITASVEKVWNDDDNAAGLRPEDVTVYLLQGYEDSEETDFDVIASARLDETNNWKSVFGGLDKTDANGNAYIYKFQEVSVPGYVSEIRTTTVDDTITAVITNTADEVGHLKVAKSVTGDDADTQKEFMFTVRLTKEDKPVTGVYSLDNEKGTKTGSVVFDEDGKATFTLKDKESAVIKNLPVGASYEVTEAGYTGWTPSDNNVKGTISKNETATVEITNSFASSQSMTISKEVTGTMGNRSKDFTFKLTLTGGNIPKTLDYAKGDEKDTLDVKDGTVTFTLHHGESIVFPKVPNGVQYNVEELDGDGYRIIYENPDGTIDHKDVEVKVVNEKNFVVPTNVNPILIPVIILPIALAGIGYVLYRKKKRNTETVENEEE